MKNKYDIEGTYFIVSNQFYEHKNHKVVFEAISILVNKGETVNVVFTGKFDDEKNPNYIKELKQYIQKAGIESHIKMLGVIPREEQICLLQNALAVIQPSQFEGWSTVIEDAKTIQVPVIASDIPVHIEQLGDKGLYFANTNGDSLADMMQRFLDNTTGKIAHFDDYTQRVSSFAKKFIDIFK